MTGTLLRFYMHENRKHHHVLLYEWLLERAKATGIAGGCAFRAIAGFGRHGVLHEEHFFELAGDVPVEVDFIVSEVEADRFLDMLAAERVSLVYARLPVEFGAIEGARRE